MAKIAAPLNALGAEHATQTTAKRSWCADHEFAFTTLKELMCPAPVLAYFQEEMDVILHVDASDIAVDAVLAHEHSDGVRPVAFAS